MTSMSEVDEDENRLAIYDTELVHSSFYLALGPAAPTNQVQVPLTNHVKVSVPVPSLDLETNHRFSSNHRKQELHAATSSALEMCVQSEERQAQTFRIARRNGANLASR